MERHDDTGGASESDVLPIPMADRASAVATASRDAAHEPCSGLR
ncbi:MAG: hypothetical protein AAGG08_10660 [Actinomycetota bacterium]